MSGMRMMCGVMVSTRSVRVVCFVFCVKSRPMIGRSPRNGVLSSREASFCWIRPARKFVSPSFRRMVDSMVRVMKVGCAGTPLPPVPGAGAPWFETSTVSLSVTSRLW